MLEIGSLVDGKYRILQQCGQGGMSVVYMARNERANRIWAIKEVRKDGICNFEVVKQGLLVETDLLKKLQHPHLPGIVDVIDEEDSFLIVMDFIEGKTLSDILREEGPQPQECVVKWAKQLCQVLAYLHSRNPPVIYRDMKPANIMLKPDGNVVLFDFGTAREYKTARQEDTTCLGTRGYAAPEQYGGQGQSDARTDLFSLGATMYHLLTGHNPGLYPYGMTPIREWNDSLSDGLESIVATCTQTNPDMRYQSCEELLYALEHYGEMEFAYKQAQARRLYLFMIPVVLALMLGMAAAILGGLKRYVVADGYGDYMTAAGNSTDKEEELENYRRAVRLDPGRGDAYMGFLLEGLLDDNVLSEKESESLRNLLIEYGVGGRTNEASFRKNKAAYERFSYECGIAYYYRYEDKSDKKLAKSYFGVASASKHLETAQVERAGRLWVIADYYSRIGSVDETGDMPVTYRQYWEDLVKVSSGNLVEADNERTAMILYGELVGQMISCVADFKEAGVTGDVMKEQLYSIESHLQTDFAEENIKDKEWVESEKARLKALIQQADRMIQSAFE